MARKTRAMKKVDMLYCRKCQEHKPESDFYKATDPLDSNGFMSICNNCLKELFNGFLNAEKDIYKAIYATCKAVNMAYMDDVADSTKKYAENKIAADSTWDIALAIGWYRTYLSRRVALHPELKAYFEYVVAPASTASVEDLKGEDEKFIQYLNDFWGEGMEFWEYEFLEKEMARFKETHRFESAADITLLREICYTLLDIKKARKSGGATDASVKKMRDLMKDSSLTAAQQSAVNSGRAQETFGQWIAEIEQKEPAEWYQEQEKFKDIDGIEQYLQDYLVRPLKNFITQSKDFRVTDGGYDIVESGDDEEEGE